jgi:hypothetical protein
MNDLNCKLKEPLRQDYTEWQRNLWEDKTLDEVFELAAKREKERNAND